MNVQQQIEKHLTGIAAKLQAEQMDKGNFNLPDAIEILEQCVGAKALIILLEEYPERVFNKLESSREHIEFYTVPFKQIVSCYRKYNGYDVYLNNDCIKTGLSIDELNQLQNLLT